MTESKEFIGNATYSPEDNKLRIYPFARLDSETYARVKAAGFSWAPKQELFVAPAWAPGREDFLIEMCGEIGDEDISLVDRAETRAERFEGFSENRERDAEQAHQAVSAIADNIPLGQPILIGHHSEKRARKDAEKIQNGMRRAVKMWEQSQYWADRAQGAIRHAKYKELPAVRARRIKGLEADKRKQERARDDHQTALTGWKHIAGMEDETRRNAAALHVANTGRAGLHFDFTLAKYPRTEQTYEGSRSIWSALEDKIIDGARAAALCIPTHERSIAYCERWIAHYENRLAYEKTMLAESGGPVADRFNIEVGGRVLNGRHNEWVVVLKVNRKDGQITSVTTNARYVSKIAIENVKDYRAPEGDDAAKVKAATKLAPMCNYPGEGFHQFTKSEWERLYSDYKGSTTLEATPKYGRHRLRFTYRAGSRAAVFITDSKRIDPPAPTLTPEEVPQLPARELAITEPVVRQQQPEPNVFDAMRQTLKAGVQVVSAPQLFPTPPDLANRMVELAEIEPSHRVLEPSAGTGNILRAIGNGPDKVAVEINQGLIKGLANGAGSGARIVQADFLGCNPDHVGLETLGRFDRILMNPPFANAQDIAHIKHAVTFLKPGGRLVAICAGGPRQEEQLKPLAASWERLPADTFKESGTGVNTVLLTIEG